jgi:prophage antirepressor-like protein
MSQVQGALFKAEGVNVSAGQAYPVSTRVGTLKVYQLPDGELFVVAAQIGQLIGYADNCVNKLLARVDNCHKLRVSNIDVNQPSRKFVCITAKGLAQLLADMSARKPLAAELYREWIVDKKVSLFRSVKDEPHEAYGLVPARTPETKAKRFEPAAEELITADPAGEPLPPKLQTVRIMGVELQVYGAAERPLFRLDEVATHLGYSAAKSNDMKLLRAVSADGAVSVKVYGETNRRRILYFLTVQGLLELFQYTRKLAAVPFKREMTRCALDLMRHGVAAVGSAAHSKEEFERAVASYAQEKFAEYDRYIEKMRGASLIAEQQMMKMSEDLQTSLKDNKTLTDLVYEHYPTSKLYREMSDQMPGLFTPTEVGAVYGLGAEALNKILVELKVQKKYPKQYVLTAHYQRMGIGAPALFDKHRHDGPHAGEPILHRDGTANPRYELRFTARGIQVIGELLSKHMNIIPHISRLPRKEN